MLAQNHSIFSHVSFGVFRLVRLLRSSLHQLVLCHDPQPRQHLQLNQKFTLRAMIKAAVMEALKSILPLGIVRTTHYRLSPFTFSVECSQVTLAPRQRHGDDQHTQATTTFVSPASETDAARTRRRLSTHHQPAHRCHHALRTAPLFTVIGTSGRSTPAVAPHTAIWHQTHSHFVRKLPCVFFLLKKKNGRVHLQTRQLSLEHTTWCARQNPPEHPSRHRVQVSHVSLPCLTVSSRVLFLRTRAHKHNAACAP